MSEKLDLYGRVTNKILADLERGNLTWFQPWKTGHLIRTEIIKPAGLTVTAAAAPQVSRPALSSLLNAKADLSGDRVLGSNGAVMERVP